MQIRINGRPQPQLKPGIERRLVSRRGPAEVEGRVLDGDAVMAATRRGSLILFGAIGTMAAAVNIGVLIAVAVHEPRSLTVVAPVVALVVIGLGAFLPIAFRSRLRRMERRLSEVLPRMPRTGVSIRADDQGLALDGRTLAWGRLQIEGADIVRVSSGEGGDSWYIDALTVADDAGGRIVLDAAAISDGRRLIDAVWRRLRPRP